MSGVKYHRKAGSLKKSARKGCAGRGVNRKKQGARSWGCDRWIGCGSVSPDQNLALKCSKFNGTLPAASLASCPCYIPRDTLLFLRNTAPQHHPAMASPKSHRNRPQTSSTANYSLTGVDRSYGAARRYTVHTNFYVISLNAKRYVTVCGCQ